MLNDILLAGLILVVGAAIGYWLCKSKKFSI
jgi:hypothetical protein